MGVLKILHYDFQVNRDQIFKSYQGWLLLPFTIVAFTMTSIYILAVSKALVKHRVSRKFYALLLNRSIGTLSDNRQKIAKIYKIISWFLQQWEYFFTGDLISCIFTFIIIAYVLAAKKIKYEKLSVLSEHFAVVVDKVKLFKLNPKFNWGH